MSTPGADETYTYACGAKLTAYSDALGTASLSYDGLSRLTAFSDSNGNNVSYSYDAMGRILSLSPAQGTNYRTEYTYNANGSVATVTVYDAGTAAVTSYAYSTTTGRLTSRNFPEASGQYVKTAYSYDAYGRLEYETVTRETGSTTNLYRTQYAYSRIAFGIQLERTEQAYSGGAWANANKTQYQWDTLGRQAYEQRYDWDNGAWSTRYDITQVYDQNGNRTGYDKNVAAGYTADYGKAYNLSYNYDSLNQLTAITDSNDLYYSCSVTSDANMNITLLEEKDTRRGGATLYSYFEYDALNRMTAHKTKANLIAGSSQWWWTKRAHQYDAVGRLVRSTWKTWPDGQSEPGGNSLEHVYAGAKHVQNYDGTNYGRVWHWASSADGPVGGQSHMGPLASPNADTASQQGYNLANGGADVAGGAGGPAGGAGGMTPQKRTFLSPTTEGDQRHLFGQGRPMAKDSSGSGSAWATGTVSRFTGASGYNVESRLMFEGTVATTDMSRATDVREKDRICIFGTGLSYAGSYGRVTSESIGRDLNPSGRGDGYAYLCGDCSEILYVDLPGSEGYEGHGNSVNNSNCGGSPAGLENKVLNLPPNEWRAKGDLAPHNQHAVKRRGCNWGSRASKEFHKCADGHIHDWIMSIGRRRLEYYDRQREIKREYNDCTNRVEALPWLGWGVTIPANVSNGIIEVGYGLARVNSCYNTCELLAAIHASKNESFDIAACKRRCWADYRARITKEFMNVDVAALYQCLKKYCSCIFHASHMQLDHDNLLGQCEDRNRLYESVKNCPHAKQCCPVCKSGEDCSEMFPETSVLRAWRACSDLRTDCIDKNREVIQDMGGWEIFFKNRGK